MDEVDVEVSRLYREVIARIKSVQVGECFVDGESEMDTVNNYKFGVYDDNEVYIQTEPRQLEANNGKVFLTVRELLRLLALLGNVEDIVVRYKSKDHHNV
jgi:hypothetical protein